MTDIQTKLTIEEVKRALESGDISQKDLQSLIGPTPAIKETVQPIAKPTKSGANQSQIISYIGSGLIFLGVVFISSIYWADFDNILKVGMTLGVGLLLWLVSIFLLNTKTHRSIPISLHLMSMILTSGGIGVVIFELLKPDSYDYSLYFGVGFLFLSLLLGIQLFFQRHWANVLAVYGYSTLSLWLFYTYFAGKYSITTTTTQYMLFALTGAVLFYGSIYLKKYFVHVSRLLQIGGSMFLLATAYGIATEYKWFYGIVMAITLMISLGLSIYKKYNITLGVTIFWLFSYVSWLNGEYFRNQVSWGQSLVVIGVAFLGVFQLTRYRQDKNSLVEKQSI